MDSRVSRRSVREKRAWPSGTFEARKRQRRASALRRSGRSTNTNFSAGPPAEPEANNGAAAPALPADLLKAQPSSKKGKGPSADLAPTELRVRGPALSGASTCSACSACSPEGKRPLKSPSFASDPV